MKKKLKYTPKLNNGGSIGLGQGLQMLAPLAGLIPGFGTIASMGLGLVGDAISKNEKMAEEMEMQNMSPKTNTPTGTLGLPNYEKGGKIKFGGKNNYQNGGSMLKAYNGPSHEQGGIPVDHKGNVVNPQDAHAEVEGGETSRKGYVFSDTLTDPVTGKTFAEMSKTLNKKYKPQGYDSLRDKTKELEFKQLEARNDNVKKVVENIQQEGKLAAMFGQQMMMGGNLPKYNNGGDLTIDPITGLPTKNPTVIKPNTGPMPLPNLNISLDDWAKMYGNVYNPTPAPQFKDIYYGQVGNQVYTYDKSKPNDGWKLSNNVAGNNYVNNVWAKDSKNLYAAYSPQTVAPTYVPSNVPLPTFTDNRISENDQVIRDQVDLTAPETGLQKSLAGLSNFTKQKGSVNTSNEEPHSQEGLIKFDGTWNKNPYASDESLETNDATQKSTNNANYLSPLDPNLKGKGVIQTLLDLTNKNDTTVTPKTNTTTQPGKDETETGNQDLALTKGDKIQMASNFISPLFNLASYMQGYDKEPEMGNKYEKDALNKLANLRIRPDFNPIHGQANATREAINEGSSGMQRLASLLGVNNQVGNTLASAATQVANQNVQLDANHAQALLMQGERDRMEKIRAKGITDANQAAQFNFLSKAFEQLGPAVGTIGSGMNNRAELMTQYNMMKNIYPDFNLVPFHEFVKMMGDKNYVYKGGVGNYASGNVAAAGAGNNVTNTSTTTTGK